MGDPGDAAEQSRGKERGRRISRVHLNIGPECNNNCLFCMEQDRDGRRTVNGALAGDKIRAILEENRGAEEVCFTSGEPTLVPDLPRYIRWASRLGYGRVSLMTNGRRLAYADYCSRLVDSGLDHFYVSVHGHTARLHDSLVRTPGAFAQTVTGLDNVGRLLARSVGLHSSTVVTRRNLGHLQAICAFLRGRRVQQVVFNVMQATGRADAHFERLFPPYQEIAATFARLIQDLDEEAPPVFLVDIPRCATERIPGFNRGVLEAYVHYEVGAELRCAQAPEGKGAETRRQLSDGETVEIARADHDTWQRSKREACKRCKYDGACPGVWNNYLKRYGWEGLDPVK